MIDEETLEIAIAKAVENGWDIWSHRPARETLDLHRTEIGVLAWESIVFNWGFARAIWPDDWKKHLQNMVVAEDPIAYLAPYLT